MNSDTPSKGSSNMPQQMLTDTHHTGTSSVVAQYNATPLVERRRPQFNSESEEDPAAKERVAGTHAKPDYVLYYEGYERRDFRSAHIIIEAKLAQFDDDLPVEVLGQMAYYAKCVWETQFTRTFVPVVLLHGTKADLCLFARSGYSRVPLGQFIKDAKQLISSIERTIASTIRKLWFFLIQPSERFGHFVNVSSKPRYLRFNGDKCHATIEQGDRDRNSSIRVTGKIDRKMEVSRRAAYLLKVRYQGKDAVLKLSWIPVNRQPEGVLYDLLSGGSHKVDCIPTVFNSGILVPNFLGYRLEFILMEYCGKPLIDDYKGKGNARSEEKHLLTCAENVIQK
ncbi:hypothetical protein LPJ53_001356, partial [Coemansia erecta]